MKRTGLMKGGVVPPGIEHIIYPARKCLVHNVLTYLKIIETT